MGSKRPCTLCINNRIAKQLRVSTFTINIIAHVTVIAFVNVFTFLQQRNNSESGGISDA